MEIELAKKIQDMDFCDILKILMELRSTNVDAYKAVEELVDDL